MFGYSRSWWNRLVDWIFLKTHTPKPVVGVVVVNGGRHVFQGFRTSEGRIEVRKSSTIFLAGDVIVDTHTGAFFANGTKDDIGMIAINLCDGCHMIGLDSSYEP